MEKTVTHLPENKKEELKRIADTIREMCDDVGMIILFGSYSRGDWREAKDLKPDRKSGHVSDYDILVITQKKETAESATLWKDIAEKTAGMDLTTHARIIAHDIQDVNIKLAEGQYFFTDIRKEGRVLYDSGNCTLSRKRRLKPEEKKRIVQDHFEHWYGKAHVFFEDFKSNLEKHSKGQKFLNQAAFHLNQATEASYKSIILVFTNYNPNEHYLGLLNEQAGKYSKTVKELFKATTEKEQRLFDLLDYAYIGARYDASYRIEKEDLDFLSERVKTLLEIAEKTCREKVEGLGK